MVPAFLRRLLLATLLVAAGLSPVAAQDGSDVRQAWQLLDYIAVDYGGAVADGKVVSDGEYAEMREFSATARERIGALPDNPRRGVLLAQADGLIALVQRRADAAQVAQAAHALADGLLAAYGDGSAAMPTPDPAGAAGLYAAQCAGCHGATGRGDGPAAAGMVPAPIDFTDLTRATQRSPLALYEAISRGVAGTAMPAYAQLDEAQRWALAFHVGGMAFDAASRREGEALWARDDGRLHAALPSLQALVRSSPAQLAQVLDARQAAAITAFLRAQPQALRQAGEAKPATLALARSQLQAALRAYADGDRKRASALALSAYLDGVEPVEPLLAARDTPLLRGIETAMGKLRSDIAAGAGIDAIRQDAAQAVLLFDRADRVLQEGRGDVTAAFLGSFAILLREGLEAMLVVIGMIAFLRKSGRSEALPWVHAGWTLALAAGGITWALATWLVDISGASRELTEGLSSLFAALVLLGVGIWMHQKSLAGRWQHYLRERVSAALGRRSMVFLFVLAFVAVYREVFETILFYAAMWSPDTARAILAGMATGVALLALVAWALLRLGMHLPIGKFFAWSSALIAVLAVVLAGKGVAALQEAGWIGLGAVAAPRVDWLGVFPTWQTLLAQLLVLLVAALGFWINQRGGRPAAAA
ncbi:cytochrome c/FTR1 family iron permease [Thermomonas sp. XSG]|jgi:high-affinity iron transporter|uniref:cytochrome c/FTR1 family iron permease n=1 Tax=Thermomonas sp. XSG TaxID=2771436 RepID=UPI00086E34DA|nr:cytochrome c/FTR1 family iron permease [Thermomonas sp. XSG]ODU50705.1 MAG: iron permease [Xanthomonadaceae bacterium SCN 69-48]QNU15069.1 c-type cytochrome [Thermomonas sp. XSG]